MTTVLVTAGPTREHLDDVRFLSNGSSGRMGYAIATAAREAGARVLLVTGPTALRPPDGVETHRVVSALEMHREVVGLFGEADVVFGVAAVADYRPACRLPGKPAKGELGTTLELVPNPDILAELGRRKGRRVLVGFALESTAGGVEAALARGRRKLEAKNLDLIVVNRTGAMGAAENEVVVLDAAGGEHRLPRATKEEVARRLVAMALERFQGVQEGR